MIKEKYLIVGHMWWRNPVVGKGTRETEVMDSNPANNRENFILLTYTILEHYRLDFP